MEATKDMREGGEMVSLDQFVQASGVEFQDPSLLTRALTHRSYVNENPDAIEDNERLEFLGDAALDFLSASWLYHRFPEMDEGQLTRLRSALVRTEQLARFAEEIRLGEVLLLGRGEALSGGRQRPALLCGTFEALIGALYIDAGLEKVRAFMEPRFQKAVARIVQDEQLFDPRSMLQIRAQAELGETPMYRTVDSTGPDHEREFQVEVLLSGRRRGLGRGASKQQAAMRAAAAALQELGWSDS